MSKNQGKFTLYIKVSWRAFELLKLIFGKTPFEKSAAKSISKK